MRDPAHLPTLLRMRDPAQIEQKGCGRNDEEDKADEEDEEDEADEADEEDEADEDEDER